MTSLLSPSAAPPTFLTIVRSLFPDVVAVAGGPMELPRDHFAREALAAYGVPATPILEREDGSPRWPHGFIGSIARNGGRCAVAVAPSSALAALALYIETTAPLDDDLWSRALSERERTAALSSPEPHVHARMLFAAKHAYFETRQSLTGQLVAEFLHVECSITEGRFEVWPRLRLDDGGRSKPFDPGRGRIRQYGDLVIAGMVVGHDERPANQTGSR